MTPDLLERLKAMPSFKAWWDQSHVEADQRTLLRYFEARNDPLSSRAREMIQECSDPAVLEAWLDRAFAGETAAQIFGAR